MVTPPRPPSGELIGRDQELTVLLGAVEAADNGHPSSILVGGDAGIGKTRLLDEMASRSRARVVWGGCLPLGERGVPYLALIEILRSLDERERASLPSALAMLTPDGPASLTERPISRVHLFQTVLEFF
jgi:predicted ATPase